MARRSTPKPPARRRTTTPRKAKPPAPPPATTEAQGDETAAAPPPSPPKPAPRRRAAAKPAKAPAKPVETPASSAPSPVPLAERLPDLPAPPRLGTRRLAFGLGTIAALGTTLLLWRSSRADQPDYTVVEQDGDIEVREYPAMVTAGVITHGPRKAALDAGFDVLFGYLVGKDRAGGKLAMTAPVLSDGGDTSAWRTRFIMPAGLARADLPAPPQGVTLDAQPPQRVAVVRFGGRADDAKLAAAEARLREWLKGKSYPHEARAEHAFYNSPFTPGPLRRNEVLVVLSTG